MFAICKHETVRILSFLGLCTMLLASQSVQAKSGPLVRAKVAMVFDLTGFSQSSLATIRGFEIAAEEMRADNIFLEIKKFDSRNDGQGTLKAMNKALQSSVDILIAEEYSSKALIAGDIAERAGKVMITPNATSPRITASKKYVFRCSFDDDFQGDTLAKFAFNKLNLRRAAVVWDSGELYSSALAASFKRSFAKLGGQVVLDKAILPDFPDLPNLIAGIGASNIDFVFMPLYEKTAAQLLSEATRRKLEHLRFIGADGWLPRDIFSYLSLPRKLPFEVFWSSHFSEDFRRGPAALFEDKFKKRYNISPSVAAVMGYDTGRVVGSLLQQVGPHFTSKSLADHLRNLCPVEGLSGTICYRNTQGPQKTLYIRTTKNGDSILYDTVKP